MKLNWLFLLTRFPSDMKKKTDCPFSWFNYFYVNTFQYTYFLLITFILEAGAGGLAYYYEVAVEDELRTELNTTFITNYALDTVVTNAVDTMQTEVMDFLNFHTL